MNFDLMVYESEESRTKDSEGTTRFYWSFKKLKEAGISIERVMCSSPEDIDGDSEAGQLVRANGMSALPIAEFRGVVIASESYPTDKDLVNYLDLPEGTLDVDRDGAPAMTNDLPPPDACDVRPRN